ncbi:hypothetical protein [Methylobacterium sp. J-090]|uniref:hypothetical protein n=1 Tax=Methylobacterium sp. J-090 TaxID=2836666 RepID=UPI001FB96830|nr:hypothetical protein [Methylobacterium sp. J-090]MCJ2084198.1 hypothetical protein [Methylobacterium sp. J-090]
MTRTHTHTVAELAISAPAYDEIRKLLEAAGYQHAFDAEGMIDMTGIGLTRGEAGAPGKGDFVHPHWTDLFDGAEAYLTWREGQHAGAHPEEALTPCLDEEIEAWETWAKDQKFDMEEHPLHYLFMDAKTAAARHGWKAGLAFARRTVQGEQTSNKGAMERLDQGETR